MELIPIENFRADCVTPQWEGCDMRLHRPTSAWRATDGSGDLTQHNKNHLADQYRQARIGLIAFSGLTPAT